MITFEKAVQQALRVRKLPPSRRPLESFEAQGKTIPIRAVPVTAG
jgi:hypothetical protein